MAPLPNLGTSRLYIHYQGPAGPHEVMFRYTEDVTVAEAVASARGIILAMAAWVTTDTVFDGARFSQQGSPISLPVPFTPVLGTSSDGMTGEEFPNFVTWIGRDDSGRRVRWVLNGIPANADSDYRLGYTENAAVAAVVDALRSASPSPVTRNNLEPVIYNYANTGRNAYFQRKRRRSA